MDLPVSFDVYDANGDGVISVDELKQTLTALMQEQGILMSSSEADQMVHKTFLEASSSIGKDSITFEE